MDRKTKLSGFKRGFISGLGWSFGVTVGFAIISTLLVLFLNFLGGLPIVGEWIANVVEVTIKSLNSRSILAK